MSSAAPAADLLSELVGCASVNPGAAGSVASPFGEGRLAALLADRMRGWGAEVTLAEVTPGRPNLLARWPGKDRSRTLMFEAHMDTVPPAAGMADPFRAAVRDGRLYGLGACDDKGPMAAMLLGIRAALDAAPVPPVDLVFAATCDEELGAGGARALVASGVRPTAIIVAEPTDLRVVTAHKGAVRWRLRTPGVAAHSSMPERGRNAIVRMARAVTALADTVLPALATRSDPDVGAPTLSVGTVRGGTLVNVVPDACDAELDRRLVPGETAASARAEIAAVLDTMGTDDPEFRYDLDEYQSFPPYREDRTSAVARLAQAACRDAGEAGEFIGVPWAANAGVYRLAGIPCVIFGPGSVTDAHTPGEFIGLEEVTRAARVCAAMVARGGSL